MLKNIFIFILNLYIITAFFHNSNFFYKSKYKLKLTKNKYKTLKYLNNTKLNSYYCKWYYNESKNNYYNYINYTIYNKLYFKKNLYTYLHLIDQYTKIFVSNNFNHTYNINIIHPRYYNIRFNIEIYYNNITNKLYSISLSRNYCNNKNYWSNNTDLKIKYNNLKNNFLFGKNIALNLPLQNKKLFYEYDYIYPYLYEIKNTTNNIILKLPDNIFLDIPKLIIFDNNLKLKVSWSLKDDYHSNILDINYFKNGSINNLNLFSFFKDNR